MVKNVLLALGGFIVIGLLVLWILNGGIGRTYNGIKNFTFFATSTEGAGFTLPFQPDGLLPRITDKDLFPDGGYEMSGTPEAELSELQNEYERIAEEAGTLPNVGNPSPAYGKVIISRIYSSPRESSASREYIALEAAYGNTTPVSISGWMVRSAITGAYAPLSNAAHLFWMGAVNTLDPIALSPGHTAFLSTGVSPVGTSFRENKCTGYLAQFQSFAPPLALHCPAPSDEVPLSTENLQQLGSECMSALAYIPTCEFPKEIPNVTPQCRAHLQTVLSYNGCVGRHSSDTDFSESTWRLFAGSPRELWGNTHDALQLLDAEGRVVDVFVY